MTDQIERWTDVGAAIRLRMDELRLTKAALIRMSGISDKTLNGYLEGEPIRRSDKKWDLCEVLEWTPDSIDRIVAGERPVRIDLAVEVDKLTDALAEADRLIQVVEEMAVDDEDETKRNQKRARLQRMKHRRTLLEVMLDMAETKAFGPDKATEAFVEKFAERILGDGVLEENQLTMLVQAHTSTEDRFVEIEEQVELLWNAITKITEFVKLPTLYGFFEDEQGAHGSMLDRLEDEAERLSSDPGQPGSSPRRSRTGPSGS